MASFRSRKSSPFLIFPANRFPRWPKSISGTGLSELVTTFLLQDGKIHFGDVFRAATGLPYDYYQYPLGYGDAADLENANTLRFGLVCESYLVHTPTGLGKTAAAVLVWLWNRVLQLNK